MNVLSTRDESALHACHTAAPETSYPRGQLPNSLPSTGKRKRNEQTLTYKSQLNVRATNRTYVFFKNVK